MTAHRHYRAGEWKDCVTASNRAFESMLKAICDAEGWTYGKGDRASELITLERFPLGLNWDSQGARKGGILAGDSDFGMRHGQALFGRFAGSRG